MSQDDNYLSVPELNSGKVKTHISEKNTTISPFCDTSFLSS